MTERRIAVTFTVRQQIELEHTWWREHRDQRLLFEDELDSALKILALLPGIGAPYQAGPTPGLRRLYVDKIDCHLLHVRRRAGHHQIVMGCETWSRAGTRRIDPEV